jgi:cell division septation protein DedD
LKELGKLKDSYDFSFDARKLGLVLLGASAVAALVFVLGVSVGIQWERKKSEGMQKSAVLAAPPKPSMAAPQLPAAPPVYKPVTTVPPPPVAPPVLPVESEPGKVNDKKNEAVQDNLTYPKVLTSNSKKTAPLTPEKKKTAKGGRYTVQLSAFNEEQAARAKADKLKKKGFDARVYKVGGKKGGYNYKVHVGSFATRDEAVALLKKLKASEKGSPFVTSED